MARLIDATRIEQYILNNCSDNEEVNAIYGEIINAPTIEAEPVKHGRWIKWEGDVLTCSNCKHYWIQSGDQYDFKYCSCCGAKMDLTE